MLSLNDKISARQLQALLFLDIFGTGVIYLPRIVSEHAGQDGWLCVLTATVAAALCAWLITLAAGMFPGMTFGDLCSRVLSRPVGIILSLAFAARIVLNCALELRLFGEILKDTMLYFTPGWLVCAVMLLLGAYISAKGYETRGRIAEILFFVVFVPLIAVFAVASSDIDFSNLLPVFEAAPKNVLEGGAAGAFAFTGLELLLIALPHVSRKSEKKLRKNVVVAVLSIGLFMAAVTAVTIARFGPGGTARQMWPVLEMMDTIDIPGAFIERQDAIIMSFWIISTFATVNAGLFFSSLLIKDTVKKGRHSWYILGLVPVILVVSRLPDNINKTFQYLDMLYRTAGAVFPLALPLLLLITAKIRRLERNA